jgi:predicted outer membrane protein
MKRVLMALALGSLIASGANAQNAVRRESQQPGLKAAPTTEASASTQQPAQQSAQHSGSTFTDAQIAAFLNGGNEAEVNLAKLAEKKAKHDDVKMMAQKMAEAHTKLWAELNQVAMQGGLGEQANGNAAQPPNMSQQGQHRGLDFLAISHQISRQCESSLIREFQDKQGDQFDKAYVGWNIGAHMHMLDALKVIRGHASPQLQQTLAKAEQSTQDHLDHFKKLMHELESGSSGSSRTP